jgi:hypothetical protein
MQRGVSAHSGGPKQPRQCPRCGAPLRMSHTEYAGAGNSTVVLRCSACGHTLSGATRTDADRRRELAGRGRSKRHQPVDEGPPDNPVLDPQVARRLLEDLGG